MEGEGEGSPAGVLGALLPAIAEGRVADVLALVDPQVVCITGTRPARSMYEGHAGMVQLIADLRAVYGRYRVEVDPDAGEGGPGDAGAEAETRVVVRMRGVRETEGGDEALPSALVVATVRGGLVAYLETMPED